MTTLQQVLHARVGGDTRAALAVLETRAGSVRILFGDVDGHGRVILGVEENNVSILYPDLGQGALAASATAPEPTGGDLADLIAQLDAAKAEIESLTQAGALVVQDYDTVVAERDTLRAMIEALKSGQNAPPGGQNDSGGTDTPTQPETPPVPPPDVSDHTAHTVAQLKAIAEAEGVALKSDPTRAEIAAAIIAKRAAATT